MTLAVAALALAAISVTARPADGQLVRGLVVDEQTRQPLRNVDAALLAAGGQVLARGTTDDNGFFQLKSGGAGEFEVHVQHLGYASETRRISLAAGQELVVPAFVLRADAVALDSIEVTASQRAATDPMAVGFSRSSHLVAGERLAAAERRGSNLLSVFREMSGIRVKEWMDRNGQKITCVEGTRAMVNMMRMGQPQAGNVCSQLPMVIDGVVLDSSASRLLLRHVNLQDYESVEFLPPVEAGARYGLTASATGAIVLWSRGRGPHASAARNR